MKDKSILKAPLLPFGWKRLAFVFFPLPVLLVIGLAFVYPEFDPNETAQLIYGFLAIGFGILNLKSEKVEDEMVKSLHLQAFQTSFYWLIWGVATLMMVNYLRFERLPPEIFSACFVLFLLNAYVYPAFQFQKYIVSKN